MKTTIQLLCLGLFTFGLSYSTAFAQSPEKMSYQAVIRDVSNGLVINETIEITVEIIHESIQTGIVVYRENHTPITNVNGLISIEIGTGDVLIGELENIDWGNGPYLIRTQSIIGGASSAVTSVSELVSVPYALHAKTAQSLTGAISETDPVFEASVASIITASDTTYWNNHIVDTDTHLDEEAVDAYVANNGYLTSEIDGSVTNEIELPEGGTSGQVLETNGAGNYSWVNQTINTDNQKIIGSVLSGTNLTIGIEGGNSQMVNLSTLQDGDAWEISGEDVTSSISRNGSVGIGTSTPSHQIHVEGNARITEMSSAVLTDNIVFVSADGELRKMSVESYKDYVVESIFPPSDGSLSGAPGICEGITVSGTYTVDELLDASNLITVEVNVTTDQSYTTAGTYTISSNSTNGYSFHKEGIFLNVGIQSIGIQASGTPIAAQTDTFIINYNGESCSVDVTVNL